MLFVEEAVTVAEEQALKAPTGTAPDWFERIEKAKKAREMGILLQHSRRKPKSKPAPVRRTTLQWFA